MVEFAWHVAGPIRLESRRPVFPSLPEAPGLYRFAFEWRDRPTEVYIGETDRLRRRAQHYRTPGVSQPTNVRMNEELLRALSEGTTVVCSIVTAATVFLDAGPGSVLDLGRKTSRLIVENAAIAATLAERERDPRNGPVLMNRPGVGEADWG